MITPAEIKQKAERKYIAYLQSTIAGNSFFPLVIVGNKKPDENAVRFENELTELINHSYEKKGYEGLVATFSALEYAQWIDKLDFEQAKQLMYRFVECMLHPEWNE